MPAPEETPRGRVSSATVRLYDSRRNASTASSNRLQSISASTVRPPAVDSCNAGGPRVTHGRQCLCLVMTQELALSGPNKHQTKKSI